MEDDLSDKNMSDVTIVEIDESDEKNNSKKKKESKAKSAVSEPGSSSKSEGSNTTVNDEPEEKSSKRKRETRAKSAVKESGPSSKDEDSNTKANEKPEEKTSKRKIETRSKSAMKESGSSSKDEDSNAKEKKNSKKRQKVTSSASRESSSDFTSEEPEWLKNSQSIPVVPFSIPIENIIIQSNTEADHSPAPTQNQNPTERVFVAPYYVDLDAYRQELRDEEQEENDDLDDDENVSYALYGNAKTKIVGIQYYNGIINKGEAVTLIREPSNPYDKNAIRVDNIMGVQVGHIPRDVAAALAPLADKGEIKIEATITGNGVYSAPLQLHVYGLSQAQESISNSLKRRGITFEPPKQPRQTKKSRAEAASRAVFDEAWRDLVGRGQEVGVKKKQEAFEKIGISIADLEKLPEAPQPEALLTRLLPYQKQGLGWMLSHEHPADPTEEDATQFWVLRSNLYYNVATSYSSKTRPEFSRGGILADDMGLGKTLQTISLIVSDTNGGDFITTPSPTSSDYSKTTLIVSPLSILGNWVDQINAHVKPGVLSYYVFHGPNRISDPSFLSNHDVVITTYQVLASSNIKDKRRGLFAIKWRRVVLDEGHIIRTNKTKQSQAACALEAERRWVLSGTPIMNQLNDMYSLVRFLRITPFQDYDLWTRVFSRPVSKGDFEGIDRLASLIRTTCLRRTKDMKFNGRSILDLPPINSYLHKVKFSPDEKKKYNLLDKTAKDCFRKLENAGGRGSAATLLEILMRMRQVCDHWKLAEDRLKIASEASSLDLTPENAQLLAKCLKEAIEDNEDCCICLDPLSSPVITLCRHVFDRECIEQVIEKQKHACPMCRNPIHKEQLIEQPLDSVEGDEDSSENSDKGYVSSSKIDALLEFLKVSNERDPTSKSVVFSQWTSFLNLVEPALHHANIKFVRLDGKMPRPKREDAMRMFQNDPEIKVFLISLKCGSLGLNLTAADQCFIMDPWWNPSIEDQAVDRIYRLGQTRPVSIFRFVIENTIEDRVIELQEKKRSMVSQAFGEKIRKDASKRLEARLEDLRALLTTK
ncbi:SNF2 family helicase [Gigaspora margarita]|uniref:SNF2 family helicase n=1 Tax=Gigaspora margarita TaxID=4874 RepID=A0A8H3XKY9_GIGMA|nr:SNF2 family helicase [Gigaspora margarita]